MKKAAINAALALSAAWVCPSQAFEIQFDYRLDTANFFTVNPQAKTVLEAAGSFYSGLLQDQFDAYSTTNLTVDLPNGPSTTISSFVVPANSLTVFVGGVDYSDASGILGVGGPAISGALNARGEPGANPTGSSATDFAPLYGSISFDTSRSSSEPWYFDPNPNSTETFSGFDFYSVALHEIGHVLGFGTAPSFERWVDLANHRFLGIYSMAVYGAQVPLASDDGHWLAGLQSTLQGTGTFEVNMDPSIAPGQRVATTDLDIAALRDIGWEVMTPVPEPSAWALFLAAASLFAARRGIGWSSGRT